MLFQLDGFEKVEIIRVKHAAKDSKRQILFIQKIIFECDA
jgi:hypothetical protein